jgi:hypothetical protein
MTVYDENNDYGKPFLLEEWKQACDRAKNCLIGIDPNLRVIIALQELRRMRSQVFSMAGVICSSCGGEGMKTYSSTATWKGGIGGQSITEDVCDKCWGTGRSDVQGINLKEIYNKLNVCKRRQ